MKKAIMSVMTVWILVTSMFIGLISFSDIESVKAPYIPHSPFRINNNVEFASMAGSEGWAGDGSPGNPYIIEGYNISGVGYGYCIYIGNTTVYFVVRACYLHHANGSFMRTPYHSHSGIILYKVQNGTITNNTSSSSIFVGIHLEKSSHNTIANNTLSSNSHGGIGISWSNYNTISNNTVYLNDKDGIQLIYSSYNTVINNEMTDGGIYIWGNLLEHWNTHIIDTTNTVNGKPVHYWKNQTGGIVPLDAGQVILANCTNVTVENQNVIDGTVGILLGFSNNNTIGNNNVSKNKYGIFLENADYNTITSNNLWNNSNGITLYYSIRNTITNNNQSNNGYGILLNINSNYNIITNNSISWNRQDGIVITQSSNSNTIEYNKISSNSSYCIGIGLGSFNNKIYHNNIIGNSNPAYDDTNNGNQWDNGYPSGGNYWSDYTGNDSYMGPNQDIPGSDGIGDIPYDQIDGGFAKDNYPLMSPIGPYIFLYQGWNLISIPFIQPDTNIDSVLSSINGSYDAVQWFNSSDSSDPWKHHHISKPSHLNDFTDIDHKIGFWIHITEPGGVLFKYFGTQPTSNQSISLHPGWNMVGYPSLTNRNRTAALNNLTFGVEVDAIWTFDAATQTWEEIKAGDYFEVGRGYWIHAAQECVWEVPL
jgi:parallel beta-helix repeat protein